MPLPVVKGTSPPALLEHAAPQLLNAGQANKALGILGDSVSQFFKGIEPHTTSEEKADSLTAFENAQAYARLGQEVEGMVGTLARTGTQIVPTRHAARTRDRGMPFILAVRACEAIAVCAHPRSYVSRARMRHGRACVAAADASRLRMLPGACHP